VEYVPVDLTDAADVAALLASVRPDAIIHTAAATPALGQPVAEETFWQVNVMGTLALARWAVDAGSRLVHVSSDAVFGGREQPYTEADPPAPINPYGASKAAAEAVVQALCPAAAWVRTSLIYGAHEPDHSLRMARDFLTGERQGALFTDEIRCPVFVDDLARGLLMLAESDLRGPLHLAGAEALSRYDFGAALLRWAGDDPAALPAGSVAGSGLRRPAQVVLRSARSVSGLPIPLRGVREVVLQEAYHGTNTGSHR
jgi:dTDP-4-dehydrorhamnose reductase